MKRRQRAPLQSKPVNENASQRCHSTSPFGPIDTPIYKPQYITSSTTPPDSTAQTVHNRLPAVTTQNLGMSDNEARNAA